MPRSQAAALWLLALVYASVVTTSSTRERRPRGRTPAPLPAGCLNRRRSALPALELCLNGTVQHTLFCVWLRLLGVAVVRLLRAGAGSCGVPFFLAE